MATTAQLEQQLLLAAVRSDMFSIMHIVNALTVEQKESISLQVFDEVLLSITHYMEVDPIVCYGTLLTFMRTVGRHLSMNSVITALEIIPRKGQAPEQNQRVS